MEIEPRDLIVWLSLIDVNRLTQEDQDRLAELDIESDADLERLVVTWLQAQFDEHDKQNKSEMLAILDESKGWSEKELRPIFDQIAFPSGQDIENIDRFLNALRSGIRRS